MPTTIFTNSSTTNGGPVNGYSLRCVGPITGGALAQIRVTFIAPSDVGTYGACTTDHCSIGISNGTGANTTATPVELTFSGGSGFNLTTNNQTIVSDWVNLSGFTSSNLLVVIMDMTAAGGGGAGAYNTAFTGATVYLNAASASYNQSTVVGYSTVPTATFGFPLIEVQAIAPTIASVNPSKGPTVGGTVATILGTGFTGATAATFDVTNATDLRVYDDGTITCLTPAHVAGSVSVSVTTPGGTGTDMFGGFNYYDNAIWPYRI